MPEATVTKIAKVKLKRTCSNCGHVWFCEVKLEQTEKEFNIINGDAATAEASKKASNRLEERISETYKRNDPWEGVICPKCGNLSTIALETQFPNGYTAGVKSLFIKSGKGQLVVLIMSLIGAIILAFIAYKIFTREGGGDYAWFVTLLGIACIVLTLLLLYHFWKSSKIYIRYLYNYHRVIERTDSKSDEELLQIVRDICHSDNNRLSSGYTCLSVLLRHLS